MNSTQNKPGDTQTIIPPHNQSLKPFFTLWTGQAISLFGSQLVQFALIWWLTQKTGSATILATATLVGMLPQVVLGPFVGVLVDRWSRRLIMLAADSFVALATVALAVLFWLDMAATWHIFLVLFIRALGGGFHWPAMTASTTLMVPESQLTRVQGFNQMLQGGLNIVSAPMGALLLQVMPIQGVLMVDVVTAVFAILPLFLITIPQPSAKPELTQKSPSFRTELVSGFRYVWQWPSLMLLLGMAMLINMLLTPAFSLLPLLVTDHFGGDAIQLGILESAIGAGILAGGLVLGAWGGFKRKMATTLAGLIGLGAAVLLLGLTPASYFWIGVAAMFLMGSMTSLTNGPIFAIFQVIVSPEMQGRFFTLVGSLSAAMSPLGLIIAGPVADWLGVRVWYWLGGVIALLVGVIGFFTPSLLNIEIEEAFPAPIPQQRPAAAPLPENLI